MRNLSTAPASERGALLPRLLLGGIACLTYLVDRN